MVEWTQVLWDWRNLLEIAVLMECGYFADISRNRLTEMPIEICEFFFLEQLNCRENQLRTLPDAFSHLKCLVHLDVRYSAVLASKLLRKWLLLEHFNSFRSNQLLCPPGLDGMKPSVWLDGCVVTQHSYNLVNQCIIRLNLQDGSVRLAFVEWL